MQPPKDGTKGIHEHKELDGMAPPYINSFVKSSTIKKKHGKEESKRLATVHSKRSGHLTQLIKPLRGITNYFFGQLINRGEK